MFEKDNEPFRIIKWKEILEHLENATDRCEDVANILEGNKDTGCAYVKA